MFGIDCGSNIVHHSIEISWRHSKISWTFLTSLYIFGVNLRLIKSVHRRNGADHYVSVFVIYISNLI